MHKIIFERKSVAGLSTKIKCALMRVMCREYCGTPLEVSFFGGENGNELWIFARRTADAGNCIELNLSATKRGADSNDD